MIHRFISSQNDVFVAVKGGRKNKKIQLETKVSTFLRPKDRQDFV